ncbi:olfactory receptor 13H1-like [Tiliqua scincoides]|uniref:olfactory receptor 13H1-like n=1 Tax=Tiliqua scincoides TaxID=71010 RepID=UPI003462B251
MEDPDMLNETEIMEFVLMGFADQPKIRMTLAGIMTIVYVVNILGNGLIILVVITDPRLHNPMYFFLSNLATIDICLSTSSFPQSIVNCLVERPTMSYGRCYTQMLAAAYFGTTECFLLAIMAYDRYVAISKPLRYTIIMNWKLCVQLSVVSLIIAVLLVIVPCVSNPSRFCRHNRVDHFACELTALMKLVCSDMTVGQMTMYFTSSFTVLFPFSFILFSYLRIIVAILRIHSAGGRLKAFSTCGSHLAVVVVYYGISIALYIKPQSKDSQDTDKIMYVINAGVVPSLNPLIYTLRNQEVKGALKRLQEKKL